MISMIFQELLDAAHLDILFLFVGAKDFCAAAAAAAAAAAQG
jgi:hypothetical protein